MNRPLLSSLLGALFCLVATGRSPSSQAAEPEVRPPEQVAVVTRTDPAPDPATSAGEEDAAKKVEPTQSRSRRRTPATDAVVVRNGESYHVKAGQVIESVVVTGGSVLVEGEVTDNVVVILGSARINGKVGGNVVNVGSGVELGDQADVEGDVVGVGGGVKRSDSARVDGEVVNVGVSALPESMRAAAKATLYECILKVRPLSFGVGWVWWVWGGLLSVHVLLAALFPGALQACVQAMSERPLATTLLSVLALPLVLLVLTLLLATGLGVLAVPFFLAALLCAAVLGKDAVLVQLGSRMLQVGGLRDARPAAAFVAGLVLVTALYLVPVIGLLTWLVLSLWALGGAFMALFRRDTRLAPAGNGIAAPEAILPTRPEPPVPAGPVAPASTPESLAGTGSASPSPGVVLGLATTGGAALAASEVVSREAGSPLSSEAAGAGPSLPPPPLAEPAPGVAAAATLPALSLSRRDSLADLSLPRAAFWPRVGALLLDWLPLLILVGMLPDFFDSIRGLLRVALGVTYYTWFLTWRGTTLGGLIFRLRVIRTDGRPLDRPTALVRAAGAVLSFLALGLGWLWPLWDVERQTWHDKLAGTVLVRDDRMDSLV